LPSESRSQRTGFDADGFFHKGDIAYCDSKTELWYIVDRKKELIKVRGFQVAPAELEAVLLKHDGIADATAIGIPSDTSSGELTLFAKRVIAI
jgi:acyl-CoA synthetase (AMP-forming)/AMP-acid ligase II